MKRLSEVCQIVGVTRRTLQEYDKIGLVKPTSKTKSGYWLYDDASIQKLLLTQVFVEAGYERKTIKCLLESPRLDILEEFDHLIETLEKKRKRLDGMINTIKTLKVPAKLPESTLRAMENLDVSRVFIDKSFVSCLKDSIAQSAEYNESDNEESEMFLPFWYNLIGIGSNLNIPEKSVFVQAVVAEAYKYIVDMSTKNENNSDKELSEAEIAKCFSEGIQDMLSDPKIYSMVELQCGNGAVAYIIRAVQLFSINKSVDSTTSQKGK